MLVIINSFVLLLRHKVLLAPLLLVDVVVTLESANTRCVAGGLSW